MNNLSESRLQMENGLKRKNFIPELSLWFFVPEPVLAKAGMSLW
jgi:hypothetical protein